MDFPLISCRDFLDEAKRLAKLIEPVPLDKVS